MMQSKFCVSLKQLQEEYDYHNKQGLAEWRICENLTCYVISFEVCGDQMAWYKTDSWEVIKGFCANHSNGTQTINGLGCTDDTLSELTIAYIHSQGKKYAFE